MLGMADSEVSPWEGGKGPVRDTGVPSCSCTVWLPCHYAAHTYSNWPHSDPKHPRHFPTISLTVPMVLFLMALFWGYTSFPIYFSVP